jgi:hypothetical protein
VSVAVQDQAEIKEWSTTEDLGMTPRIEELVRTIVAGNPVLHRAAEPEPEGEG